MVERKKKKAGRGYVRDAWIQYYQRIAQKAEALLDGDARDEKVVKLTNLLRERENKMGQNQHEEEQNNKDEQGNQVEKEVDLKVGRKETSGKDSPWIESKKTDLTPKVSGGRVKHTNRYYLMLLMYQKKRIMNKAKQITTA